MGETRAWTVKRWLIPTFCVLAGIRTLTLSAAFPFFTNMDEAAQFDVVVKYSHLEIPRVNNAIGEESARLLSVFGTSEYSREGKPVRPLWALPKSEALRILETRQGWWQKHINFEALEPPLYYFLAGIWFDLGRAMGLEGLAVLYWVRLLNVGLSVALVWLAFLAARTIFPDRSFLCFGVPFLVAIWPQDAFYSVESDTLSPICFGLAFIGLLRMLASEPPSRRLAFLTGLALAATALVKLTNLSLVMVAIAAVMLRAGMRARENKLRLHWPALLWFFVAALGPLAIWGLRNYWVVGDLTASAGKIHLLGWTTKPAGEWWPHPIFTAAGFWTFWSDLTASLWRGELVWLGQRLSFRPVDLFYTISSTVFLASAAWGLWRRGAGLGDFQRKSLSLALGCFAASVLLLALLSVRFDFGQCRYPSHSYPFFSSGRLIAGAIIPFLLLYVYGLEKALRSLGLSRVRWIALGAIGLCLIASEVVLSIPVFSSPYNLFHL